MGASVIHFRGNRLETNDATMEVWLRLLVDAARAHPGRSPWLEEMVGEWEIVATSGFGYGVVPELDEYIIDNERQRSLLVLCATARKRLDSLGDPVSAVLLNALRAGPEDAAFTRDVPAAVFTSVAAAFTALVSEAELPDPAEAVARQ